MSPRVTAHLEGQRLVRFARASDESAIGSWPGNIHFLKKHPVFASKLLNAARIPSMVSPGSAGILPAGMAANPAMGAGRRELSAVKGVPQRDMAGLDSVPGEETEPSKLCGPLSSDFEAPYVAYCYDNRMCASHHPRSGWHKRGKEWLRPRPARLASDQPDGGLRSIHGRVYQMVPMFDERIRLSRLSTGML